MTDGPGSVSLGELLAAAVRPGARDEDGGGGEGGELRALAAFRAARDAGTPAVPPRRSDDWRPSERRARRSVRPAAEAR
ncbi:hypothetical protein [Streptomyces sp. NPDC050264]|uniref:hypothetical protein n=1 Tax=Streptomyces sp. NPDC050264 TaxID=3155038 RepID=UPI003431D540